MKKRTKRALTLAALLMAAGLLMIRGGLTTVGFDLSRLDSASYSSTETVIREPFSGSTAAAAASVSCPQRTGSAGSSSPIWSMRNTLRRSGTELC